MSVVPEKSKWITFALFFTVFDIFFKETLPEDKQKDAIQAHVEDEGKPNGIQEKSKKCACFFFCKTTKTFINNFSSVVNIQPTAHNNSKNHNYCLFIFSDDNFFSSNSASATSLYQQRRVKSKIVRRVLGQCKEGIFGKNTWATKNWRKHFERWNSADPGTHRKKYVCIVGLRVLFIAVFLFYRCSGNFKEKNA